VSQQTEQPESDLRVLTPGGVVPPPPEVTSEPAPGTGAGAGPGFRYRRAIVTGLIAVVAAVFLVPFYWLLVTSTRQSNRIFADAGNFLPTAPTLQNFEALFNETPVMTWFTNSVILAAGSAILSMVVVTMAAYPLARIRFPFRNALFVSVLASQMLPFHLLLIPLFLLMIDMSLTVGGVNVFGIDSYLSVIAPTLAHPFGLFYMRQYMLGLPQDVLDAARADGASEYRIFLRVVVPMVKPALAVLAIIFSLEQWNDLLWPLIVMRSEDNYPLSVGISTMVGLYRPRWDLVMSASVMTVLPIMILFFLLRKWFIGGLGQLGTGGR
jgi:ABC-type glycerol-3-phosphate transport system permease component